MRIAFRPVESESDRTFVVETWLESQRASYSAGLIQMDDWYETMRPQIVKAMARTDMQTIVAYEHDDPDFLYGWLSADPTEQRVQQRDGSYHWWPALVLYVFVKAPYRRRGIARALFRKLGVDPEKPFLYSCNTQQASRLSSKVPLARFHPLVVRHPKEAA